MQCTQKAFTGLVALMLAAATPVLAQDTTSAERTPLPGEQKDTLTMPGQGGGADTAGFAGMERNDPSGAARADTSSAGQADAPPQQPQPTEAAAGESRDPNGFRWTLPSDFANAGQPPPAGATGAVQPNQEVETGEVKASGTDSTKWGGDTEKADSTRKQ